MNEEQFALFLHAQQAQQEQITTILQLLAQTVQRENDIPRSATNTPSTSKQNDKLSIIKHFNVEKFHADSHRIQDFIDYFENKCKILDVNDENLQKDILINTLSPEIFRELKIALTPNFETSTYHDIRCKLLDLYRIKKTRYRALTEFWNCTRETSETMEHYANRLKSLSCDCDYKEDLLERQLRDRFATGLNHAELETDLKQKSPF